MSTVNKNEQHFIRHGLSLESPLENQTGYLTPPDRFFVCNSGTTPIIDSQNYSLRIWGDGVSNEITLSYEDLLTMPQHTVPAVLECAGNHRSFFRDVDGLNIETPAGTEELIWSMGAMGMAEWTGVSLRNVLNLAGVDSNAVQVCGRGSETDSVEGEVRLPMPMDKALDIDTLLALQMNGEPLPADHGFPVRVLVPGWIGAYSIKWVQDIEVSMQPIWVRRNTTSYVMKGELWPESEHVPSQGKPLTQQNIKSSLALPWPTSLASGLQTIHGYARSPGSPIASVKWSDNQGETWSEAALIGSNEKYGWVRFEFEWQAEAGEQVLMTKATDQAGRVQPDSTPFNKGGYLYNAVHPHPVTVV